MKTTVTQQAPLLDFLHQKMGGSKNNVRKMLRLSRISVDGVVIKRPDHLLEPGQVVALHRADKPAKIDRTKADSGPDSSIIKYEDPSIIVVEKPPGLLSIGTKTETQETLHALMCGYVHAKEQGRVFIVHRLDRDVGGLMVLAKTPTAKADLQLNWAQAKKRYMALVVGKPPQPKGRVELYLEEESVYKMRVVPPDQNGKLSITEYKTVREMDGYTLLDITLYTGRRHQIRISLAHLGCPIAGDRVYGTAIPNRREILLYAYYLSFRHPDTGSVLTLKNEVPKVYRTAPRRS